MDKKRIILLSSLLGLAIALLGVLLLVLGRGKGSQPAVAAQPVLTQTAVITAAPTAPFWTAAPVRTGPCSMPSAKRFPIRCAGP